MFEEAARKMETTVITESNKCHIRKLIRLVSRSTVPTFQGCIFEERVPDTACVPALTCDSHPVSMTLSRFIYSLKIIQRRHTRQIDAHPEHISLPHCNRYTANQEASHIARPSAVPARREMGEWYEKDGQDISVKESREEKQRREETDVQRNVRYRGGECMVKALGEKVLNEEEESQKTGGIQGPQRQNEGALLCQRSGIR